LLLAGHIEEFTGGLDLAAQVSEPKDNILEKLLLSPNLLGALGVIPEFWVFA